MDTMDEALWARRLEWADAQRFAGTQVAVVLPGAEALPLAVQAVEARPAPAGGRQFSILFVGPASPLLPQQTYRIRHPELGDYAMLITALGRDAIGVRYEACFAHVEG